MSPQLSVDIKGDRNEMCSFCAFPSPLFPSRLRLPVHPAPTEQASCCTHSEQQQRIRTLNKNSYEMNHSSPGLPHTGVPCPW